MNQLATTESNEVVLIPEAELAAIEKMDTALTAARQQINSASSVTRAFVQAKALLLITKLITPGMMTDIKQLMGSPLGFRTDRDKPKKNKEGKWEDQTPYPDKVIKECVVLAWLKGARLDGNQFNILAGNAYFTKEFCTEYLQNYPGLTDFRATIGTPMFWTDGKKFASVPARAEWKLNGVANKAVFHKSEEGIDERIVVSAYSTSGIDQLKGLAESKLMKSVIKILDGSAIDPETCLLYTSPSPRD